VFGYGDDGDKFYVILEGLVTVRVPTEIEVKLAQGEEYNNFMNSHG
jgi:hypothetical protein